MPELAVDISAFGVHGVDDLFPAIRLFGGEEAWHTGHSIALFVFDS